MPRSSRSVPRVTIGLPVYNGEAYLQQGLGSILSQSFEDFELIISDNASTDRTPEICQDHALQDPRVRYDRCPTNVGAARNYNRLVGMARGEYFKWAAHDDNCHPAFLAKCVPVLDRDRDVVVSYPRTHVIDGRGAIMSEYRDGLDLPHATPHERLVAYLRANFMRRRGLCNPIFGVLRLSSLRRTRLIQDFLASDLTLLAHLALLGKFVEVPEVLFERRVHLGNSTMANRTFSDRLAWFNPSADRRPSRRSPFDNHLALRVTHIRDLYRAIAELVDDRDERRRCRIDVARLLIRDPKWMYKDLKYSLGFRPSSTQILTALGER